MDGSELIQEEVIELIAPEIIRPEVNFLLLPFFVLSWKEVKKLTKIEYYVSLKRGGEEVTLSWVVSANVDYGIPTPFDKEVKGVVDAIIERVKKPISNPLELPYISEMARMMGLKPGKNGKYPGWVYRKIKESFRRMTLTGVDSKGIFYIKGKRTWAEKTFHLYDSVIFRGEKLLDGAIAERNYLWLNDLLLGSINDNYVKPIDYAYFQNLKNYIAKRLYEFLGIKFYGLRNKREQFFRIGYSNLCQLLPITPQKSFSLIKKNLTPAHDELIQTGFLAEVEYEVTKDRKSFNILYFPGERARKEMKGDWGAEGLVTHGTAEIPELEDGQPLGIEAPKARTVREKPFLEEPQSYDTELQEKEKELSKIAQELINRGITKSVAIDFAYSFPEEYLREKIDLHDVKKATGELWTNAAGWLREAIVRDYALSEEQQKKQEQLQKQQAGQEARAKIEVQAKEIQEQRLKEALASFPPREEWVEAQVLKHINVREEMRKVSPERPSFTEAEIERFRQNYRMEAPQTDEERRDWLMRNEGIYNLQAIISALEEEGRNGRTRFLPSRKL